MGLEVLQDWRRDKTVSVDWGDCCHIRDFVCPSLSLFSSVPRLGGGKQTVHKQSWSPDWASQLSEDLNSSLSHSNLLLHPLYHSGSSTSSTSNRELTNKAGRSKLSEHTKIERTAPKDHKNKREVKPFAERRGKKTQPQGLLSCYMCDIVMLDLMSLVLIPWQ